MVLVPFGPLRWYRLVRYDGTDCSATVVPIRPLRWYRLTDTINFEYSPLPMILMSVNLSRLAFRTSDDGQDSSSTALKAIAQSISKPKASQSLAK